MNESILISVKKALGLEAGYEHFDPDIIMHINSVLSTLTQLGVGPEEGFKIDDDSAVWTDITTDVQVLNFLPTYVYLKVRLTFDPPTGGVLDSIQRQADQYEWRINVAAERTTA